MHDRHIAGVLVRSRRMPAKPGIVTAPRNRSVVSSLRSAQHASGSRSQSARAKGRVLCRDVEGWAYRNGDDVVFRRYAIHKLVGLRESKPVSRISKPGSFDRSSTLDREALFRLDHRRNTRGQYSERMFAAPECTISLGVLLSKVRAAFSMANAALGSRRSSTIPLPSHVTQQKKTTPRHRRGAAIRFSLESRYAKATLVRRKIAGHIMLWRQQAWKNIFIRDTMCR